MLLAAATVEMMQLMLFESRNGCRKTTIYLYLLSRSCTRLATAVGSVYLNNKELVTYYIWAVATRWILLNVTLLIGIARG